MFSVDLSLGGKKFQREWIFKALSLRVSSGEKIAITGGNGSGKSTLIKCLSGQMPLTEGELNFKSGDYSISMDDVYKHLVISAPYLELPEEFTLEEFLRFHFSFKKLDSPVPFGELVELLHLKNAVNKPISLFSSGMKQRLKLGICFFSQSPLVLLDEPTSNLDEKGIQWYRNLIADFGKSKCLLIASNDSREYDFCEQILCLEDYKRQRLL
ncbi:ABC transporter ATP-binding protein [Cyclobacterium jeungdonense]|uniref:ATP-binding cassette domain-containing protein n=1 Tax=Cyclobacterium jeungdonense TaxID=708087 RepID=A0ABT8C3T9_9BACT|nr:ATP-binding cassette domain-containing protein [Cyclobacterium jeungdonense]MDN3686752.1 ATP-binding cassette domain-containing protein [Cyclobacterium jeungdonense]